MGNATTRTFLPQDPEQQGSQGRAIPYPYVGEMMVEVGYMFIAPFIARYPFTLLENAMMTISQSRGGCNIEKKHTRDSRDRVGCAEKSRPRSPLIWGKEYSYVLARYFISNARDILSASLAGWQLDDISLP